MNELPPILAVDSPSKLHTENGHMLPVLPSPTEYGWVWKEESGSDELVIMDLNPIPESVVELSMCKCNKNGMICSQCENLEEEVNIEEDGYEDIQF